MQFNTTRRNDKWIKLRQDYERCRLCMYDGAPVEWCCKWHCGEYKECENCNAQCRNTEKLCVKG